MLGWRLVGTRGAIAAVCAAILGFALALLAAGFELWAMIVVIACVWTAATIVALAGREDEYRSRRGR
jgi:hypothetical protein